MQQLIDVTHLYGVIPFLDPLTLCNLKLTCRKMFYTRHVLEFTWYDGVMLDLTAFLDYQFLPLRFSLEFTRVDLSNLYMATVNQEIFQRSIHHPFLHNERCAVRGPMTDAESQTDLEYEYPVESEFDDLVESDYVDTDFIMLSDDTHRDFCFQTGMALDDLSPCQNGCDSRYGLLNPEVFRVYSFTHLTYLDLGTNVFLEPPVDVSFFEDCHIRGLTNLVFLNLGRNSQLSSDALVDMVSLQTLYLGDNRYVESDIFLSLTSLRSIQISNLSCIKLDDVPLEIEVLWHEYGYECPFECSIEDLISSCRLRP